MKKDYFKFLLDAISHWGEDVFDGFIDNLLQEIKTYKKSWKPKIIREILVRAYDHGYPKETIVSELETIESDMLQEHDTSGRVDECFLHAKAWTHLDEREKAFFWLSRSLKESFSVGYRKDYQFNRWLEWLIKANAIQPEQAAKRLTLFLGFLPHLKQTVEGSPFYGGARQVLKIGYSMDFGIGVQQFIWQMDHGIISFEDGLSLTLSSMISHANSKAEICMVSLVYEKLLLFIAEKNSSDLLEELLKKQFQLITGSEFENKVRVLFKSINIYCLERNRLETIRTIQNFLEEKGIKLEGLPTAANKPNELPEPRNELVLMPDHKHISEREVLSKVRSFSDFKALFDSEDKANSFFSWHKVFQKISATLTLDNLKEIVEFDQKGGRQSELLSLLSIRAMELGDETLARKLADRSLSHSSPSGWSSFYDGGTRLHAMRAFQKINEAESKGFALRTLTEDIMQSKDPDSLLASWDEILPLITKESSAVRIWAEIEDYLKRLFENAEVLRVPDFKPVNQKEALVMLLVYLAQMKVRVISTTAKTIIPEMANQDFDILSILYNDCKKSIENSFLFSEIILLMSVDAESFLFGYAATLKEFAVSDNFKLRANAIEALSNLGMAGETPIPTARELSFGFSLHLPVDEKFRHIEKVKPFENIQDTDDYLKIISSHQGWLDLLSEKTGLAKENIVHRWTTLMNEKAGANQISQAYEKELQQHLSNLSLDFPFQRPRIAAVETGLDYLLTELIDSGKLDISSVWPFHTIDPALEKEIIVEQRPTFVSRITETSSRYVGEEWIDEIDNHKRLKEGILNYGDLTVIAEFSYTKQISWGEPSEIFNTYCRINNKSKTKTARQSNVIFDCNYEEYQDFEDGPNTCLTVSHQSNFDSYIGYLSRWVAFNPVVARELGWVPSTKANFAWENEAGDLMSQSVFWRSGNIFMAPPGNDSESAEGWYVLLTKKGAEALKKLEAKIIIVKNIKRDWYYEHPKSRETSIEIPATM